jgi:hypothetical protein
MGITGNGWSLNKGNFAEIQQAYGSAYHVLCSLKFVFFALIKFPSLQTTNFVNKSKKSAVSIKNSVPKKNYYVYQNICIHTKTENIRINLKKNYFSLRHDNFHDS